MCARGVGCKRSARLFAALAAHQPPCILDRDTQVRKGLADRVKIVIFANRWKYYVVDAGAEEQRASTQAAVHIRKRLQQSAVQKLATHVEMAVINIMMEAAEPVRASPRGREGQEVPVTTPTAAMHSSTKTGQEVLLSDCDGHLVHVAALTTLSSVARTGASVVCEPASVAAHVTSLSGAPLALPCSQCSHRQHAITEV